MSKSVASILENGGQIVHVDDYKRMLARERKWGIKSRERPSNWVVVPGKVVEAVEGYKAELESLAKTKQESLRIRRDELIVHLTVAEQALDDWIKEHSV